MNWTATKLATRTARILGLDDAGKTRLQRTFRNFVQQRYISVTVDEDDERGTLRFGDDSAAVALLLLPMAEQAVDARRLRKVADWLLRPDLKAVRPLDRVFAAVRVGKSVSLVLTLVARAKSLNVEDSPSQLDHLMELDGVEMDDPKAAEIYSDLKANSVSISVQTVNVSLLLKPFLDKIEG